jgi:hypothetical protein
MFIDAQPSRKMCAGARVSPGGLGVENKKGGGGGGGGEARMGPGKTWIGGGEKSTLAVPTLFEREGKQARRRGI